ncbi:potassium channel family protein [Micromonospora psammae]|uniref:potassium channel family protein n=1 Tax=Micromonospora sp. CPCC 205556 TaxID=3122398 RepID=UPI002FEF7260
MGGNRRDRRHALVVAALLLLAYFLVPVQADPDTTRLVLRSTAAALLVATVALLVTRQVRRQLTAAAPRGESEVRSLIRLSVALFAGLLTFALADYVVAMSRPDEFANLDTRIDALYFALATLTTIGYGDVHPQGQIARLVVCAQMAFSIGVIATGASIVVRQLTERPGQGRG